MSQPDAAPPPSDGGRTPKSRGDGTAARKSTGDTPATSDTLRYLADRERVLSGGRWSWWWPRWMREDDDDRGAA